MIKLYKTENGRILYWEAWDEDGSLVIHSGEIGDTGESEKIRIGPGVDCEELLAERASEAINDGYQEMDPVYEVVVQQRVEGFGTPSQLEFRDELVDLMNECLGWAGIGHCDGWDIGSGAMNIYCFVVERQIGAKVVLAALKEKGFLSKVTVASRWAGHMFTEADDSKENTDEELKNNPEAQYVVNWPENFVGEFDIFYC